jgi:hypothetical protein
LAKFAFGYFFYFFNILLNDSVNILLKLILVLVKFGLTFSHMHVINFLISSDHLNEDRLMMLALFFFLIFIVDLVSDIHSL